MDKTRSFDLDGFKSDIILLYNYFDSKLNSSDSRVALYITDDCYLFYCCFLALLYLDKMILLPSQFLLNSSSLKSSIDVVISNNKVFADSLTESGTNNVKPFILKDLDEFKKEDLVTDLSKDFGRSINFSGKFCFFTSGSTKEPKQILKDVRCICSEVEDIYSYQLKQYPEGSLIVGSVESHHIYGMLRRFFLPLNSPFISYLPTCKYEEELVDICSKHQSVLFITTPSFLEYTNINKQSCPSLKTIYTSGALLSAKISSKTHRNTGICPIEIYGSTEAGGIAYRQQSQDSMFHKLRNVEISQDSSSCIVANSCYISPEGSSFTMSDRVELVDKDSFYLLERTDRMVKIYEQRVSLPKMEQLYENYPLIDSAYVIETAPNTLGVLITLNKEGLSALKQESKSSFVLKLRSYLLSYYQSSLIPKKVRIVSRFPKNQQGKINKKQVLAILNSNIEEPLVENLSVSATKASMELTFLSSATYFKGHFPILAVLPGVVQLHFASYFAKAFLDFNLSSKYSLKKLKFQNLILPNKTINLSLSIEDQDLKFSYFDQTRTYSSGIFSLDNNKDS